MHATRRWRDLLGRKIEPVALAAAILALTAGSVTSAKAERGRSDDAGLRAVQAFTERYQSEDAAIADGFTRTDDCVPGMGYHYVNISRLDTRLQPSRPEAVLYAPTGDSGRRLVAAEWIVVDQDQDLTTDDDRPSLFGHDFDGPMPGHTPDMPVHYDLHAWAWANNPDGGFATWNPAITCPE